MTQEQTSKLIKVVPETDGHRVELQWAVAPESKAYKVFPCSYLRSECRPYRRIATLDSNFEGMGRGERGAGGGTHNEDSMMRMPSPTHP